MAVGPEQQKALFRAKLTSLVRSHFSDSPITGSSDDRFDPDATDVTWTGFANGAALESSSRAVVLLDGSIAASSTGSLAVAAAAGGAPAVAVGIDGLLGHALVGVRHCEAVHLLVDGAGSTATEEQRAAVATVVRRAAALRTIVSVWQVDGTALTPFAPTRPTPPAADVPIDDPWVELMREEHLDVLVDGGAVVGELLGVEVARIVAGHDGVPRLDVGVGVYDQEAFAMMNAGLDVSAGLAKVCAEVRKYRTAGAEPHPINRLARERWLRALLMNNPAAIGLDRLSPVPSLRPRAGIKDEQPVVAIGTDPDGRLVGVVCAVGLDLDLVPTAADAITTYTLDAVTLVIPPRDRYRLVDELAALLTVPVRVFEAAEPWPTATV